jgi:hypothetical protein
MARDRRRHRDEAVRITTAASSRDAEISARQRRYVVSMGIRTACFVAAIGAALAGIGWLWPILIAAALILPYVAVVMANATGSRSDGFELLDGQYDRPELAPGTKSEDEAGPDPL